MDMVEKVARAICVAEGFDPDSNETSERLYWRHIAEGAIEAMREPTEGMVRAGLTSLALTAVGMPEFEPKDEAELCFMAMIDAALTSSEK